MRKPICCPLLAFLCLLSIGEFARADEVAASAPAIEEGEVRLKNGGSLRGTIVTVEPGERVIVIVAGEKSVIPWDKVKEIVDGPKTAQTAVEPTPIKTPAGMPFVHIESDVRRPVYLRNAGSALLDKPICTSPCDQVVDARDGKRFFVDGRSMWEPTSPFRLDGLSGRVNVRVVSSRRMPGFAAAFFGGIGGIFASAGAGLFVSSFYAHAPTKKNPDPHLEMLAERTIGLTFMTMGATFAVFAVTSWLTGDKTRVELIKSSRGEPRLIMENGVFRF